MRFLKLSVAKLTDGGQLIFETVNPHSLEAFKTFWTDLTHQKPIFPEVALALCWLVGFDAAYVLFPNGGDDLETNTRGVRCNRNEDYLSGRLCQHRRGFKPDNVSECALRRGSVGHAR
jgi:hypothetical protein